MATLLYLGDSISDRVISVIALHIVLVCTYAHNSPSQLNIADPFGFYATKSGMNAATDIRISVFTHHVLLAIVEISSETVLSMKRHVRFIIQYLSQIRLLLLFRVFNFVIRKKTLNIKPIFCKSRSVWTNHPKRKVTKGCTGRTF